MEIIKANIREYGMVIALVLIAILFQNLTGGLLFRPANIVNLVIQNSYILILAIGMILVILLGKVDLSVGSLAAFTGALSGIFIISWEWSLFIAVPAVLAVGALAGAWNGFWIAYKNIPFFVVTLAGMLVFRGLTMVVLEGQTITGFPPIFHNMANGVIPDVLGSVVVDVLGWGGSGLNITALVICLVVSLLFILAELRGRRISSQYSMEMLPLPVFIAKIALVTFAINLFGYWFASSRGMPNILILLIVLTLVYSFIAGNTVIGRHIYATGGSEKAAELSGIKVKHVNFLVFVNMGMLAALAGLVFAARLNAASPRAEAGFELQAIAAAFIGGASPNGGIGKITGAITGAMVMGILNNGLSHMGIGADIRLAITGLVLLAAIIFDVYAKSKAAKTETA